MTAQRKEYKKELTSLRKEQRRLEKEISTHENVLVRIEETRHRKAVRTAAKADAAYKQAIRKLERDAAQQTRKISAYIRTQGREQTATARRIAILEGRLSS